MTASTHGRSGRPWRRIRQQILARDPYCMIRGPKCRGVSTTVDHIVPLSIAPELAHDLSNLRGACGPCQFAGGARLTNAKRSGRLAADDPRTKYWPVGHPIVEHCPWSRDNPTRVCRTQCNGFPLPIGCHRASTVVL